MKKLTAIFLLATLILTFCACGKGEDNTPSQSTTQSNTQSTASKDDEPTSTDTVTSDTEATESGNTQSTESADSQSTPSETVSSAESNVSSKEQTSSKTDTSSKNETVSRPEVSNQVHTALSEEQYYQFNNMTPNEKVAYGRLKAAALNFENSVNVSDLGFTTDQAISLIRRFAADHPQYFWISDHVSASYNPTTNKATACIMLYSDGTVTDDVKNSKYADRTKINKRKTEVEAKVKQIVSKIGTSWSDYDKIQPKGGRKSDH